MLKTEILIADANTGRGRRIANALEASGHACQVVPNGSAALEVALVEHPRVIVAQAQLTLIDAAKLAEILRANPRTRAVRFLFLGGDSSARPLGGIGDITLDAKSEDDAVLDAVDQLLDRQDRVEDLEGQAQSELRFSGLLSEFGQAELLQMLHLRNATGRLSLAPDREDRADVSGEITFREGEILAAEVGPIRGEKALFRMLDWRSGGFVFEPCAVEGGAEIAAPTRSVLAEGLRQLDEWNRLAPKLPPFESPVRLCVERSELPQLVHPLTQEVLGLLEDYERVGDIVDHCSEPDYQVLRTLHTLAERGIAEFGRAQLAPAPPESPGALFGENQVRRLRAFAQSGLAREALAPDAKLLVVAADSRSLERFVSVVRKAPGVELAPRYERDDIVATHLETMARVDVDGDFGIDLVHLPVTSTFEAICDFAGHRALGTVILLDANVGVSASRIAKVTHCLANRPAARSFNVVMLGEGERVAPDDLEANLSLIDHASLFLLPVASNKDPGSLLRSLFARIVP